MNVSFTGNYLFRFKDAGTRVDAYDELIKVQDKKMAPDFDVFQVCPNELHLINGQDYRDYKNTISLLKSINIRGTYVKQAYREAMLNKATEIDFSDMNLKPKEIAEI